MEKTLFFEFQNSHDFEKAIAVILAFILFCLNAGQGKQFVEVIEVQPQLSVLNGK